VPKVVGFQLAKAKTRIRRAHCRVGKVTRKPAPPRKLNRVLSQRPKAGKRLANGARVSLWIGRAR
jgi:beta-lactam-binding protein with PASTA domain